MLKKNDTKHQIADAIMNLMLKKSIDSITVQEIADYCGVTRRTFYNHFEDKYSLVDWIYRTEAVDYIKLVGEQCSWYDAVLYKLYVIKNNPNFYSRVYRQEWFLASFQNITQQLYLDIISKKSPEGVTPELEFIVEFYCGACVKATSKWVLSGLKETPEEVVESFLQCVPDKLKEYLLD